MSGQVIWRTDLESEVSKKKVLENYSRYGSIQVVATALGISYYRVRNILKGEGVKIDMRDRLSNSQFSQRSCVGKWIKKNRFKTFPTGRHKIAALTGCSLKSVDNYMSRRRKKAANLRKDIPDLSREKVILRSGDMYFPSGVLEEYRLFIHPGTFVVFIDGALRTGESVSVEIPLEILWERIEEGRLNV
jgi:hypothetical protein